MNSTQWRAIINSPRFALVELLIVAISGAALCLTPRIGAWAVAASLFPWGFKFAVGAPLFRRARVDLLIAVFTLTAFTGLWASYNRTDALYKLYFLLIGLALYFALRSQPKDNWIWVSLIFFGIGVGIAGYFFLTHDFVAVPRRVEIVNVVGRWIMWLRPELGLRAMHPNYVAGFAAIGAPFGFYLLLEGNSRFFRASRIRWLIVIGLLLILSAIVMTTSRGILMAIVAAIGLGILWRIARMVSGRLTVGKEAVFPILMLAYLAAIVFFLYQGPAQLPEGDTGYYGNGSRGELVSRSIYLVADFPITGGGLASFPGLYSQYILNIPYYQLLNSHNLFLDVFIEQGLFGGFAYLMLYVVGVWQASQNIVSTKSPRELFFNLAALCALVIAVIHGTVDDYLYNGSGALFSLALVGLASNTSGIQAVTQSAVRLKRMNTVAFGGVVVVLAILVVGYRSALKSFWYSNLGAVQMAQVELNGFPADQWADSSIVESLQDAKTSLLIAVQADPSNRTANHRLGLISMLERDFPSAEAYLSKAYQDAPRHRGIIKSLGFCKAWLGDFEGAKILLSQIPEASDELDVYTWWWETHGQLKLSENASTLASSLAKP